MTNAVKAEGGTGDAISGFEGGVPNPQTVKASDWGWQITDVQLAVTTAILNVNAAASTSGWKTATRRSCAKVPAPISASLLHDQRGESRGRHWRRHFRFRSSVPNPHVKASDWGWQD